MKTGHGNPTENRIRKTGNKNRNKNPEMENRTRKTGNGKPEKENRKRKTGKGKPDTWNRVNRGITGNTGNQRLPQANPWLYQDAHEMKSKARIQNPVTKSY